jgi:hypothetical protein
MVAAATLSGARAAEEEDLPFCPNRKIREVVKRVGCTLGDRSCWLTAGGFCTDWIQRRIAAREPGAKVELVDVDAAEVRPGDVAVFLERAHYAWIERVTRDRAGRPVALELSEFNFGSCWIDDELMITDRYGTAARRSGVPIAAVDGGFRRPQRLDRTSSTAQPTRPR